MTFEEAIDQLEARGMTARVPVLVRVALGNAMLDEHGQTICTETKATDEERAKDAEALLLVALAALRSSTVGGRRASFQVIKGGS